MELAVNGWRDLTAAQQCGSGNLGAAVMRVEFTIGELAVATQVADYCNANNIRLQPLIGWDNGTPAPDLTSLATWAAQLGPGGTHWGGASPVAAIRDIELGNENAWYYKSGLPGDANYQSLATTYGNRARDAAVAINNANPQVGVIVELEGADSNVSTWIDKVLAAGGTTLKSLMHGPVIHIYGPGWQSKLDLNRGFLANNGVTLPYYVTETGISTDNGRTLSDNYGWPTNLTYAQAKTDHQSVIEGMASQPTKIKQVSVFNDHDNANPGASSNREDYFGITTQGFGDKGAITPYFRSAFAAYRGAAATAAGSAVSGTRANLTATAGSWRGLIFVAGYNWSSLTDWPTVHPNGWISDPGQAFAYEAHHYWDTATAPSLGSRSGQYQQPNGAGVSTLTYATELAAATAQIGGAGQAISGTRATSNPSVLSGAAGSAVSGTQANAASSATYTAAPSAATSGTRAVGAAVSENLPVGTAVSGSLAALAPSVMVSEPTRTVSGSLATADATLSTSAFGSLRSGTVAILLAPGVIPSVVGEVVSATLATVAEQRTTYSTAAAVSGTLAQGTPVRQTWTDPTERRQATISQGPTYFDSTAGQPAATFAIQPYLGPSGGVVGRAQRVAGTSAGWGAVLASDITGTTIPAGTEVSISWWARGTVSQGVIGSVADGLYVVDDGFTSVAGQVMLTRGGAIDPSTWTLYTGTTTLGASGWVPGFHRFRVDLGGGGSDTDFVEWSDVLVTVGTTTTVAGLGTLPLGSGPLGGSVSTSTSVTITSAVSGTRAVSSPTYTQTTVGSATSGTRAQNTPTLTIPQTGLARSGTRAELEAAWIAPQIGAKARSGSVVTAAPALTARASGTIVSGSLAASAAQLRAVAAASARSGSLALIFGTTEASITGRPAVSGTVAYALGIQVAPAESRIISGTVVSGAITLGVNAGLLRAVSGSLALATAATPIHPVFVRPPGPVVAPPSTPRTTLLVVETITGRKVAELPYLDLQWNSPLNDIGKCSATLPIEKSLDALSDQRVRDPRAAMRALLSGPYRFSLVPCYGRTPLMGGPMLPSNDVVGDRVAVGAIGMEKMLAKRVLNRPTGTGTWADPSRDVGFYATTVGWAIYQLAVEAISTYGGQYPSRALPLTCLSPLDSVGWESFTWRAYDLVNAWKAITDLTARIDGPDVRLEPYLVDQVDGTYVRWDLQIGDPYLPVSGNVGPFGPTPWTFAAANTALTYSIDPAGMASTYFTTGDGQDQTKEIARADSNELLALGWPSLEEVDSSSSSSKSLNTADVQNRADALITAHRTPTDTWSLEVPVDGSPDLGKLRRGDVARIEVRDRLYLEPGYHLRRITNITGGSKRVATLECNDDDDLVGV